MNNTSQKGKSSIDYLKNKKRIYVAGHRGLVGSAFCRQLSKIGVKDDCIITKTRSELSLLNQRDVDNFFEKSNIDIVILAAAKVGGIHANNAYPGEFIYENLMIQTNVINSAYKAKVDRLLFLASSCIYPKLTDQPMKENALNTGPLEPTNEPYAIAKLAGIKLCESYNRQFGTDFRNIMPTSLYGENDNYDPTRSHLIPALITRFHAAKEAGLKEVVVWGTGSPKREFLHVDDMAEASLFLLSLDKGYLEQKTKPTQSHINVGTGQDDSIGDVAKIISEVVGFKGKLIFDTTKLDGTPRKLLDVSLLNSLGWKAEISLRAGLEKTYTQYLATL